MNEIHKFNPNREEFPQILEDFIKVKPNKKFDNFYHLEVVDRDGNVIDECVGANVMTNIGLTASADYYQNMTSIYNRYPYLGSGQTEPDVASETLTEPITSLNAVSGNSDRRTNYTTTYTPTYDSTNQILSRKRKLLQYYWDYEDGDNQAIDIYEIGIGYNQTHMYTHSLLYDSTTGLQTHITKQPNTRLYLTFYVQSSISVANIPAYFDQDIFILAHPSFADRWGVSRRTFYFNPICRGTDGIMYKAGGDTMNPGYLSINDTYTSGTSTVKTSTLSVEADVNNLPYFWEQKYYYCGGFVTTTKSIPWSTYNTSTNQFSVLVNIGEYASVTFEKMTTPERLESDWIYVNQLAFIPSSTDSSIRTYNANLMANNRFSMTALGNNFGRSTNRHRGERYNDSGGDYNSLWKQPLGEFPVIDFNITALKSYNYITKEFDIDLPHYNNPDKNYVDLQNNFYLNISLYINGTSTGCYVFTNMYLYDKSTTPWTKRTITSFNNSSMTVCATDEYWDPSTYVRILDLSDIASQDPELGRKRYYVIIAGTVAKLQPRYLDTTNGNSNRFLLNHQQHRLLIDVNNKYPYELTADANPLFPRQTSSTSCTENYNPASGYGDSENDYIPPYSRGCKPLYHKTKGYFVTDHMIVFLDYNDNCTYYDMWMDDNTVGCRCRRWMTKNGDKVVVFKAYAATDMTTVRSRNTTYLKAKNDFTIFTVTDANTTPTREDSTLTFSSTTSLTSAGNYHLYSWADDGYLVVQRRVGVSEFVVLDVYGDGTQSEQYLVSNAYHARVIIGTNKCIYQDTAESTDKHYIFHIYDLVNRQVVETIEIDDGLSYTINGVMGWKDSIYISCTSDSLTYCYYFDLTTGNSEVFSSTYMNYYASTSMPFWRAGYAYTDDLLILTDYGNNPRVIYADNPNTINVLFDTPTVYSHAWKYHSWPIIDTVENGKKLVLILNGTYSQPIIDLGYILDKENGVVKYLPYGYYNMNINRDGNFLDGGIFPFNNGFIIEPGGAYYSSTYYETGYAGRYFWVPWELCLPMHMEGTTRTINSYTDPIKWGIDKDILYKSTNLLSNIIPPV